MANLYNLKRFDLNLLIIFECIYQNLSISQAAQTLFITPSAVSQSLQRLRVQLNDPLFVRSGKGITPTTVAVNLHHHLEKNLNNIEETINMMGTSELKKQFVVYGPQFHAIPAITDFMNILIEDPNLEVTYHDTSAITEDIEDIMNYRKADVIFHIAPCTNRSLICIPLNKFNVSLVCRKDHPRLGNNATFSEVSKERFILFQARENEIKYYKKYYEEISLTERNIAFRSSSLMSLANTIHSSDLIGFIPTRVFELLKDSLKLKEVILPKSLPEFTMYMIYSRSSMSFPFFSEVINKASKLKSHSANECNKDI